MTRTIIPAAIAGVIAAAIVNAVTTYAPEWEGSIWPVTITHQVSYTNNKAGFFQVSGSATKVRDCDLLNTVVYVIGDYENRTVETVNPVGPVQLRPLGSTFNWGPWSVVVPQYKKNILLKAVATHQCHPLWVTRTEFWELDVNSAKVK
jgi:hypothetical protein